MKPSSYRIWLPLLVFAAAFLAAKRFPQESSSSTRLPSAISQATTGHIRASGLTMPANAGLESLTAALGRQLDPTGESFTGAHLEKLLADSSGTGEETAMSYASRWAHADPAGLAEWARLADWKPEELNWMLYHVWAQKDPEAAIAAFGRLSPKPEKDRCLALGALIFGMAPAHPDLARKLATDHLALLAGGGGFVSGTPFPEKFQKSDAFWDVVSTLPEDPQRNRVLAGYLTRGGNDIEAKRRWSEASAEMRENLVAGGFPGELKLEDTVFEGLPSMVMQQAVKAGDQDRIYGSIASELERNPDRLPEMMDMAQEHLTGRYRTELPAYLIEKVAKKNFPEALNYWRTMPEGLVKVLAAAKLRAAAPPDYRTEMEAEITKFSPTDRRWMQNQ